MSFDQAVYDKRINDLTINENFQALGFGRDHYFFMSRRKQTIVRLTGRRVRMPALLELAPLNWWAKHFPTKRGAVDKRYAIDFAFRACERAGEFDELSSDVAE